MDEVTVESYFALLLIAVQNRIAEQVPEIKWVDQDLGQLEEDTDRPAVAFPCVLVDFGDTAYSDLHGSTQNADAGIQLRLAFNPYSSSAAATPLKYRQEALYYYDIEQKLYMAFQAWDAGELCQPMTRTRAITEKRDDLYRVRSLTFTTSFFDDAAVPVKQTVSRPALNIERAID